MENLFILSILSILILSCGHSNTKSSTPCPKEFVGSPYYERDNLFEQNANEHNYSQYNNESIDKIRYCENCATSGDYLIISFKSGKQLKIYAYKYTMEIHKSKSN